MNKKLDVLGVLMRWLPAAVATRVLIRVASMTQRTPLTPEQEASMSRAKRLVYGDRGQVAWSWGSEGPTVLLVHGWNGSAAQWAPLAERLASSGLRCVAIDVTGHGGSPGRRTSWHALVDDVSAAARAFAGGKPFAIIGHSAGGLAAMGARHVHGLEAAHWACVCSPSHPFPPIRAVKQRANPPEGVLNRYRAYIASAFGVSWQALENGAAFAQPPASLLLVYDPYDRFVDHSEGDRVLAWCPGARLVKTSGHGHAKILASEELARSLGRFLGAEALHLAAAEATRAAVHGSLA